MKIRLRPIEQINHLRKIRAAVLMTSVQGQVYAQIFEKHKAEVLRLVLGHEELLQLQDRMIALTLKDFPIVAPETGEISEELARYIGEAMNYLSRVGSPALRMTIEIVKPDLMVLAGKPLKAKLEESNSLLAEAVQLPKTEG